MLPLDDPRWQTYEGGYRRPYDASVPLRRLFSGGPSDDLWEDLWQNLYHQQDVGAASYAVVPHLVEFARRSEVLDWNGLALIAAIELVRLHNPAPPPEIAEGYFAALEALPAIIGTHPQRQWDELLTRVAVSCIAVVRGQRVLAEAYGEMSEEGAKEWLIRERGYSALYLNNQRQLFLPLDRD